ncbi:uncharacterized protein LOC107305516 [Oryza brachyantha]|uniref:uncharacterized protein LOC107305516 n=1 Tax=Oryza brachyantha TaxID=4533 RepID=UPI00077617A6|nr:uncharacterized protein LOC107305516 [Oryza brachyantha]
MDALRRDRDELLERAKAMESRLYDQYIALRELKKVNTGLQAECAKLLAVKAELEVECSQLSALKAALEVECSRLKKAKDTAVADLVEAQSQAKSMVEATKTMTQEAELARDRLITVALNVLEATPLLAQGSLSVSIDGVIQQLEKMPMTHSAELRETTKLASNHASAIVKSLYPRVEVNTICDRFAADCDEKTAVKYINEA